MVPTIESNDKMISKRVANDNFKNDAINGLNNNNNSNNNNNNINNKRMKLELINNNNNIITNGWAVQSSDDGYDDNIDDLLNDENADMACSQAIDQFLANNNSINGHNNGSNASLLPINGFANSFQTNNCNFTRISEPMIIDPELSQDVAMASNPETDILDATQGKNKILESKVAKLQEELRQQKTLLIQANKQKMEALEEKTKIINDLKEKSVSVERFRENEAKTMKRTIAEQQETIEYLTSNKNAAKTKTVANEINRQKKVCLNFSQQKLQEFYAPISPRNSLTVNNFNSTQLTATFSSPASVIIAETQNQCENESSGLSVSQCYNHFKHPSVLHSKSSLNSQLSQIPPTQSSTVYSMEYHDISDKTTNSQPSSQSSDPKWVSIKSDLETRFQKNREILSNYCINDQMENLFPDSWLRDTDEAISWSQKLAESFDKGLTVVNFENLY